MDEAMLSESYAEPVAQLLTLGEPLINSDDRWQDYASLGLTAANVPELIRMATDTALHDTMEDTPVIWAPIHAWRALGQLHAEAAIAPLTGLFRRVDTHMDDWAAEDLPLAMGLMGPAAIPILAGCLNDPSYERWARGAALKGIVQVVPCHPAARQQAVAVLTDLLARFAEHDPGINACLISALIDLRAVESAPIMEAAFAAEAVDLSVQGDWEEVQIELGMLAVRITPKPKGGWWSLTGKKSHANETTADTGGGGATGTRHQPPQPQNTNTSAKSKKKKKTQKQSRKINRRK